MGKVFSLPAIKAYWGMDYSCAHFKLGIRLMRVNFISRPLCLWEKSPRYLLEDLLVYSLWLYRQLLESVDCVCVCALRILPLTITETAFIFAKPYVYWSECPRLG